MVVPKIEYGAMDWPRGGREADDEVTELPVPKAPSPVVVSLTSDDEEEEAVATPSSIAHSDDTMIPSPQSPYEWSINVDYHVKEEDFELFDDEDTIVEPDPRIKEEIDLDGVGEWVDSPVTAIAPVEPGSPSVKVEINEDEQRAVLFGYPATFDDSSIFNSPSHSPSLSPSSSYPESPTDSKPRFIPTTVHLLQLPRAQPVVLLRRVDSDPEMVARYKLKSRIRVLKIHKEKHLRRKSREPSSKAASLLIKRPRREEVHESKPTASSNHVAPVSKHRTDHERFEKQRAFKRKSHPSTESAEEPEQPELPLPQKQRRDSSPWEETIEEKVKKRKTEKPAFTIKKLSKETIIPKMSIPKVEDGPKPVRILESRRTSQDQCPVIQSPCALLYSAEPRRSYCTKADGSEANVPAPGCRAPSAPSWLDDLLYSICRWDPRWLKEAPLMRRSKAPNILPAREMEDFVKEEHTMTYRFETLADYQRHFRRALLLQFWDDVKVSYSKHRKSWFSDRIAVDKIKSKPLKEGRVMRILSCHCGILGGKKEMQPIRGGDLVLLKIMASEVKEVFAYAEVSGGAKELLSNTIRLSPILDSLPDITHKFSFRLKICVEEHSVLVPWEPADIISCRLTRLDNFYDEVELFKLITDIVTVPELMDLIMSPQAEDENSEYMGLKSCSDMSVAQKKVICSVIKTVQRTGPSVSVVEGAPGTGKTRLLCALAQELAERTRRDERDCRIIIAGKTNRTLGPIMSCLLNRRQKEAEDPNGFRLVRLGSNRHMNDDARTTSLTVEALAERHARASGVDADRNELRKLEQERRHIERAYNKAQRRGEQVSADLNKKLASCTRQILVLEKKIENTQKGTKDSLVKENDKGLILKKADVIVTTSSVCHERNLVEKLIPRKHHVLILDDAGEITEPATIKLIVIFNITDVVLVGDNQNQVPFVPSFLSRKAGLSVSLLQRYTFALHKEGAPWHILHEQQRMHAGMLQSLESLFEADSVKPPLKSPRQAICPFLIFNCTYIEKEEEEVDFVEKLLEALQKSRINLKDVGFTSFSRVIHAAARHRAISSESFFKAENICKVDSLSGLQFKVMVVSCGLTSNFLNKAKISSIALTRAQRALFICGNFRTMEEIPELWGKLIKTNKDLQKFEDITEKDISSEKIVTLIQSKVE